MLDALREVLAEAVGASLWLGPIAAFAGGLLTAANPCVLAMVPLMIGYVATDRAGGFGRSFLLSLTFAAGLTVTFGVLFLTTWAASSFLRAEWWRYVSVVVCFVMGLHLLGVLKWRAQAPVGSVPQRRGVIGAFALGLLFGLVSLPCAGPSLLAFLAIVPVKGGAVGAVLLGSYSLGHCGLVIVGGTSMGLVQRMTDSAGWQRGVNVARRLAGGLVILVGILLLL